ncbi:MAG: cold shock domain-containing protein [Succinivibrionaceae bacterium]|nr:cold shock domain-containing protein [Succinivibrionaceae bacterium]
MDNQKTPSERISGTVKFYNRDNDYGFILADNNQEFFFRLSNFAQSVNGVISPYTKVTFVPKPTQNPKKKSYATDILLVAGKVDNSSVTSSDALPPPCPHCGARKGSHFGWVGSYRNKIYLCNVCGKEHIYGDMLKYNSEAKKWAKINFYALFIYLGVFFTIFLLSSMLICCCISCGNIDDAHCDLRVAVYNVSDMFSWRFYFFSSATGSSAY